MIYYEINETNPRSNLPQSAIDYGVRFPDLERITGADFIIVPEKGNYEKAVELQAGGKNLMEISKELEIPLPDVIQLVNDPEYSIVHWCCQGVLMVQRKSGYDFLQSMGSRLNDAIARMIEISYHQYQRIILVTGVFSKQGDMLALDGKLTNWKYASFQGAMSSIKYKGACVEFISDDNYILDWIKVQESQLLTYKADNIKWIVSPTYFPPDLPELDDPLQLMRPVHDARLAIVNIPGWGIEKVNALYEYVKQCFNIVHSPTLYQLLHYATSWETAKHLKGVGRKLIENARNYVGLQENEYLWISQNNVTVQK